MSGVSIDKCFNTRYACLSKCLACVFIALARSSRSSRFSVFPNTCPSESLSTILVSSTSRSAATTFAAAFCPSRAAHSSLSQALIALRAGSGLGCLGLVFVLGLGAGAARHADAQHHTERPARRARRDAGRRRVGAPP